MLTLRRVAAGPLFLIVLAGGVVSQADSNDCLSPNCPSANQNRSNYHCSCTSECVVYGDCCPAFNPPASPKATAQGMGLCLETPSRQWYFLIGRCPNDWNDKTVKRVCEEPWLGTSKMHLLPVVSLGSGLSYKNFLCAICNGDTQSTLRYWQFDVHCTKRVNVSIFSDLVSNIMKKTCRIIFTEPSRRSCINHFMGYSILHENPIPGTNVDRAKLKKCMIYVDYLAIVHKGGRLLKYFKNSACMSLQNINGSATVRCLTATDAIEDRRVFSLSSLVASSQTKSIGVLEESYPIECPSGKWYYRGLCYRVMCPQYFFKDGNKCIRRVNNYYLEMCLKFTYREHYEKNRRQFLLAYGKNKPPASRCRHKNMSGISQSFFFPPTNGSSWVIKRILEVLRLVSYHTYWVKMGRSREVKRLIRFKHNTEYILTNCSTVAKGGSLTEIFSIIENIPYEFVHIPWPWHIEMSYKIRSNNGTDSTSSTLNNSQRIDIIYDFSLEICAIKNQVCGLFSLIKDRKYTLSKTILERTTLDMRQEHVCVTDIIAAQREDEITIENLMLALNTDERTAPSVRTVINLTGLSISVLSLVLTLVCYVVTVDINTTCKKLFLALISTLLIAQVLYLIIDLDVLPFVYCRFLAIGEHLFCLTYANFNLFFSVEIMIQLRSSSGSSASPRPKCLAVTSMAIGFPIAIVSTCVVLEQLSDHLVRYGGAMSCWVAPVTTLLAVFATPMVVTFAATAASLCYSFCLIRMHDVQELPRTSDTTRTLRHELVANAQLTALMIVTWLVGFTFLVYRYDWMSYIFTSLFSLQGVHSFLAFALRLY